MTEAVQISVIAGLCAAIPPIIVSITNRIHVSKKVDEVHIQINSRMDELIKASNALSRAEGVVEGVAGERASAERDKLKES